MKNLLAVLFLSSITGTSIAMPEIPFCPAGGPPGWFNHFNYKRDQNIWQRQMAYNNMLQQQARRPSAPNRPVQNRLAPNKSSKPTAQQQGRNATNRQQPADNAIRRSRNGPNASYNNIRPRPIQPHYAQPRYRSMPPRYDIRRYYQQRGQQRELRRNQQNHYRPAPDQRHHRQHPERRNAPA